jgi:hypothetical protein
MQAIQQNRRLVLIVLVAIMLLCLVGVLIYNIFVAARGGGEPPVVAVTETPPAEASPESTTAPVTEEEPTAVPAQETGVAETPEAETTTESMAVASETATPVAAVLPTDPATTEETPVEESAAVSTAAPAASAGGNEAKAPVPAVEMARQTTIDEVLKNGDFEGQFSADGLAQHWAGLRTDAAAINFSPETAAPFVHSGSKAQRISIDQARQPDQYGGIFQTVELVPNEVYTLTIYGQVRSVPGNVEASSYGYRLQYALDQTGEQNWQNVTGWTELPWPEQALGSSTVTFSEYTTPIIATSEKATLFVRGWNKWPQPALGRIYHRQCQPSRPATRRRTGGCAGIGQPNCG